MPYNWGKEFCICLQNYRRRQDVLLNLHLNEIIELHFNFFIQKEDYLHVFSV